MSKHLIVFGHGYSGNGAFDPGATGSGTSEHEVLNEEFYPILKKYAPSNVDFYTTKNMFARRDAKRISGYDTVTELHLDWARGAKGGHVIIYKDFSPDDEDKRIRDVVKKHVGLRMQGGFSYRDNLYNLNKFAQRGITYRLVELGFINSAYDMAKIRENIDDYARELMEAITGKTIPSQEKNNDPSVTGIYGRGDKGKLVEKYQKLLIEAGYDMDGHGADGSFGPSTEEATKEFQRDHGLKADGLAGPKTLTALEKAVKAKEEPEYGSQAVGDGAFKDIPNDHYAKEAIEKAEELGIVKGKGDGTFGFGEDTKKEDVVVMIMRALNK